MYSLTLEVHIVTRLFAIRGDCSAGRECFLTARAKVDMTQLMSLGLKRLDLVESYSLKVNMSLPLWIRVI